jgi:hypothetical protein
MTTQPRGMSGSRCASEFTSRAPSRFRLSRVGRLVRGPATAELHFPIHGDELLSCRQLWASV